MVSKGHLWDLTGTASRGYNHLVLFTAHSFNTDHAHICHLIHQIVLLDICPWTVSDPISLEWITSM